MPNAYVLNQKPTTYGQALSLLTEMLAGAGWLYMESGDGLSSFGAGKVFTNFTASAANSWNNSKAWVRMQDPGGTKEFVFQTGPGTGGAIDRTVRFKYSPGAKFVSGSPSATVAPSATDEKMVLGSGTDASFTSLLWHNTSVPSGTVIYQGAAMAAAPYGFWFSAQVQGVSLLNHQKSATLMWDPVAAVAADTDPYVIHVGAQNGFSVNFNWSFARDGYASTWAIVAGSDIDVQLAHMSPALSQLFYVQPAMYYGGIQVGNVIPGANAPNMIAGGGTVMNTSLGLNSFNGKAEMLPIPYLRVASQTHTQGNTTNTQYPALKGWSTMMRWTGLSRNSFMDTLNDKTWICAGPVWLPWDGVTQPIA